MRLFWPQNSNLNKCGREPLGNATYQNAQILGLLLYDKNIVLNVFSNKPYIENINLLGGFIFSHMVILAKK